ncbi:hypothetical protein ACFOWB_07785 [Chenggangzhangella methanolivorans]
MFAPEKSPSPLGHLKPSQPFDGSVISFPEFAAREIALLGLSGPAAHRAWSLIAVMRRAVPKNWSAFTADLMDASGREVRSLQAAMQEVVEGSEVYAPSNPELHGKRLFISITVTPGYGGPVGKRRPGIIEVVLDPAFGRLLDGPRVEVPRIWWQQLGQKTSVLLAMKAVGFVGLSRPGMTDPMNEIEITGEMAEITAPGSFAVFAAKHLSRALDELNAPSLWRNWRFERVSIKRGVKLVGLAVEISTAKSRREKTHSAVMGDRKARLRRERATRAGV